jgi:hypothetical protein
MAVTLEQKILAALSVPQVDPFDPMGPNSPTCRWGLPLNIVGLSGIGKSQRVGAAVRSLGLPFQKVFPSHKQPEDFGGAIVPTPDGVVLECILPQARALMAAGQGVLFIDELTTARPAVQGPCLGLVDERKVGDHQLPNKVRVLAGMNPPEYAAGGFALEAALANRFVHIDAGKPEVGTWGDWMMGRSMSSLPSFQQAEQMVKDNWHHHWGQVRALVVGFVQAQGASMLHNQPTPDSEEGSGAWPSPRTWYFGTCAITTVRCLNLPKELENELLFGCIGSKHEVEWVEWCQKADLPHPEEMLRNGWIADSKRLDITMTALNSMSSWLCSHPDVVTRQALAENAWSIVLDTFGAGMKDIVLPIAHDLAVAQLNHNNPNKAAAEAAKKAMKTIGVMAKYATT